MAAGQTTGQFSAMLAELFADAPHVKKLGYDVDGTSVIVRAIFDDDNARGYSERFGDVVDRLIAFEDKVWDGIMPKMDLRMQAAPLRHGWPGGLEGMTVVLDR